MPKVYVIRLRKVVWVGVAVLMVACAWWIASRPETIPLFGPSQASAGEQVFHMVTGEFSSETKDGKKIEAYRFDPGTVIVNKGDTVTLSIYGVNGASHDFVIEGLGIKGQVVKGEETNVTFKANKEGIYRLICLDHPDAFHGGPMIGYIIVH